MEELEALLQRAEKAIDTQMAHIVALNGQIQALQMAATAGSPEQTDVRRVMLLSLKLAAVVIIIVVVHLLLLLLLLLPLLRLVPPPSPSHCTYAILITTNPFNPCR